MSNFYAPVCREAFIQSLGCSCTWDENPPMALLILALGLRKSHAASTKSEAWLARMVAEGAT